MYLLINMFLIFMVILYITFCIGCSVGIYKRFCDVIHRKKIKKTVKKVPEEPKVVDMPKPNTEWD